MNAIILTEPFIEMKSHEFPDSIEATQMLIQQLAQQIEEEGDRDKRRELFLFKMELRDHIHSLKQNKLK
ncbi:MAG: hypothetical protein P1U56_11005 [Saprospiraceae bacterium]|nr:hypothetical protein [Saprospiraceae bacterium]